MLTGLPERLTTFPAWCSNGDVPYMRDDAQQACFQIPASLLQMSMTATMSWSIKATLAIFADGNVIM